MKLNKLIRSFLLIFLFFTGVLVNAQERSISGKVISNEETQGLPGVNIFVKGTKVGASTDFDGSYTIKVPDNNAVLVFSFVGFVTQEITVGNKQVINVTLLADANELDEVVVIGYGSVKKSDVTGSVSSVKAAELSAYPTLSAEQALQGRSAGVAVQSNNGGEPGAPIKIRIRGGTSINASSDALIVVDGFVGASMPPPEDVASMEILKDASATAIYGSRGSNGVILVSTKKGRQGKTSIELNTSFSSQNVNNTLDLLNADQFASYISSFVNGYTQGPANTDWQDVLYRSATLSSTQLSFSGGTDTSKFYISGSYFNQDGVVINSGVERFNVLSNVEIDVSDKLTVGLNVFGGRFSRDGVFTQSQSGGTGSSDAISSAYRFAPDLGIRDGNGDFTINSVGDDIDNPYANATQNVNETKSDIYRLNFNANYEVIKGLDYKTSVGYSTRNSKTGKFKPTTLLSGAGVGGEATVETSKRTSLLFENFLTYKREVGNGNLTVLGGVSYQRNDTEKTFAGARGFVTNSVSYHNLGGGSVFLKPKSSLTKTELNSAFGRINYELANKYLFTITGRRDGSSNFSKNNKYAFFPSGAFAWNMGNENFLKDHKTINSWKWRFSYGATGNPSIAPYGTLARFSEIYSVIGDQIANAVAVTVLANDNLKWETSYQTDIGLDVGLLDNRINITMDYYNIRTKDLLFARPLPEYIGLAKPFQIQNIGELENKGFEFSINTKNVITDNFSWSTNFNIATNKNKMITLPDGEDILIDSTPGHFLQNDSQILREGEAVGSFYGYIYEGVQQDANAPAGLAGFENQPGGELFRDINGDGIINSRDKTIIGDPNPDFTAGLNNSFKYKNFDMNIFFNASVGGDILSYTLLELGSGDSNATTEALRAWTATNTNTNVPSAGVRAKRVTSRYVYDGSYIRLKNISLGYTLPQSILEKLSIQKVRFYISGQNLLTFTDFPGADPEINYRNNNNERSNTNLGLDYGSYPNVRTITIGLNLKF